MSVARALRSWVEPPRHLVALFVLVTLVPSAALVALGWKLSRDDRDNEVRTASERREQALDLVVAGLARELPMTEQSLRAAVTLGLPADGDAVLLTFADGVVMASPAGLLPYLPIAPALTEAPPEAFAEGEDLEFRVGDPGRAAAHYERLAARTPDAAVRAGAFVRHARTARTLGQVDRALSFYDSAARVTGVAIAGVPVDLLTRWARCELLATSDRTADLHDEAARLLTDLKRGLWPINEEVFELHLADAARWAGADSSLAPEARACARAAQWLWTRWRQSPGAVPFIGRASQRIEGSLVTLIWTGDSSRATALIAGPRFVEATWLAEPQRLLARQGFRIDLRDPSDGPMTAAYEARRTPSESGLPWAVSVSATDAPMHSALLARRRALWLAGLGLLAVLVLAGTYIVARAVSRELTVARCRRISSRRSRTSSGRRSPRSVS
jgi:hypothetical protein